MGFLIPALVCGFTTAIVLDSSHSPNNNSCLLVLQVVASFSIKAILASLIFLKHLPSFNLCEILG